jgi:hypothetical protein
LAASVEIGPAAPEESVTPIEARAVRPARPDAQAQAQMAEPPAAASSAARPDDRQQAVRRVPPQPDGLARPAAVEASPVPQAALET